MNFEDLIRKLINEPEWAVLLALFLFFLFGGGAYWYYQRRNRIESARKDFHRAISSYSKANRTGQYRQAVSALSNFVEQNPGMSQTDKAYFFLGKSYYQLGEPVLAIKQFKTLLQRFPESFFAGGARLFLGYANLRRGQQNQARTEFKRFIERYPEHPLGLEARWQLALIHRNQGNSTEAQQELEALLTSSPKEETFWTNWARRFRDRFESES